MTSNAAQFGFDFGSEALPRQIHRHTEAARLNIPTDAPCVAYVIDKKIPQSSNRLRQVIHRALWQFANAWTEP